MIYYFSTTGNSQWVAEALARETGDRAGSDAAIKAYRGNSKKVPHKDGDYTMDHSALVLLFDKSGRFQDVIMYQEDPASAEAKLRRLSP